MTVPLARGAARGDQGALLDHSYGSGRDRRQQHPGDHGRPDAARSGRGGHRRQLERAFDQADAEPSTGRDQRPARPQPTRPGAKRVLRVLPSTTSADATGTTTKTRSSRSPATRLSRDPRAPLRVDLVRRRVVEADATMAQHAPKIRDRPPARPASDRRGTVIAPPGVRWHRPHQLRPVLLKLLGPGFPNGRARPDAAGAPAPARPHTPPAGGSTADSPRGARSPDSTMSFERRRARTARSS